MPRRGRELPELEQFKAKGKELVSLAIAIVAKDDENETMPRPPIFTVRHRAIVLLEGAISFVDYFLRLPDHGKEGAGLRD